MARPAEKSRRRPASTERRLRRVARSVAGQRPAHDDRLISERVRLGIVSALSVSRSMTFNELKRLLGTSDGNLSVHARKLEEAGYIACKKSFSDRRPRTEYRLLARGRQALDRYLRHMEMLIDATRKSDD